ncbi:hypothetical protein DENSPDRAFT_887372 [Dentipellis sp. KUC8613]|nr:hypothetical protein DENSPDRAFT_887372 [Dentipellis sp. KUC8613]
MLSGARVASSPHLTPHQPRLTRPTATLTQPPSSSRSCPQVPPPRCAHSWPGLSPGVPLRTVTRPPPHHNTSPHVPHGTIAQLDPFALPSQPPRAQRRAPTLAATRSHSAAMRRRTATTTGTGAAAMRSSPALAPHALAAIFCHATVHRCAALSGSSPRHLAPRRTFLHPTVCPRRALAPRDAVLRPATLSRPSRDPLTPHNIASPCPSCCTAPSGSLCRCLLPHCVLSHPAVCPGCALAPCHTVLRPAALSHCTTPSRPSHCCLPSPAVHHGAVSRPGRGWGR